MQGSSTGSDGRATASRTGAVAVGARRAEATVHADGSSHPPLARRPSPASRRASSCAAGATASVSSPWMHPIVRSPATCPRQESGLPSRQVPPDVRSSPTCTTTRQVRCSASAAVARRWSTTCPWIRDDGYAMSFSGNRAGANGVAAPILDPEERIPLGSIAVAGPAHRVPEAVLRTHQWPSGGRARIWHHSSPPCSAPHAPRRQATPDITVFDLIESGEPQNEGDHPQPQPLTTPSVSRLRRDADVSSQDVATPPRCQATRMSASPGGTSCSTRIGIRPTRSPWRLGRPPAPR